MVISRLRWGQGDDLGVHVQADCHEVGVVLGDTTDFVRIPLKR
jgi:hypothetical protein